MEVLHCEASPADLCLEIVCSVIGVEVFLSSKQVVKQESQFFAPLVFKVLKEVTILKPVANPYPHSPPLPSKVKPWAGDLC